MKLSSFVLSIGCAACLSGCFTIESEVSKTTGEEHVVAINYGWSLFNWIPLFSGNANIENKYCRTAFFRDDVTMEKIQEQFLKHAANKGRSATELCYHNYDNMMFNLPLLGFTIPIPYVITYKEIQISGVLK